MIERLRHESVIFHPKFDIVRFLRLRIVSGWWSDWLSGHFALLVCELYWCPIKRVCWCISMFWQLLWVPLTAAEVGVDTLLSIVSKGSVVGYIFWCFWLITHWCCACRRRFRRFLRIRMFLALDKKYLMALKNLKWLIFPLKFKYLFDFFTETKIGLIVFCEILYFETFDVSFFVTQTLLEVFRARGVWVWAWCVC